METLSIKCGKFLGIIAKIFLIITAILIGLSPFAFILLGLGADFKIMQWIILSLVIMLGLIITIPLSIMIICEVSTLGMD
jgi:hypothetical protein